MRIDGIGMLAANNLPGLMTAWFTIAAAAAPAAAPLTTGARKFRRDGFFSFMFVLL
jgi:hypothetical protein